jgi:hypothetical protein
MQQHINAQRIKGITYIAGAAKCEEGYTQPKKNELMKH